MKNQKQVPWYEGGQLSLWATLVLILGILVHLYGFLGVQFVLPDSHKIIEGKKDMNKPFIVYSRSERLDMEGLLSEKVLFFDPEPLFLPTTWNYGSKFAEELEESLDINPFEPFKNLLYLKRMKQLCDVSAISRFHAEDILMNQDENYFSTFGRKSFDIEALKERTFGIKIVSMESSAFILEKDGYFLEDTVAENDYWAPVTFLVLVKNGYCCGDPLLAKSSGHEEIDYNLKEYLSRSPLFFGLEEGYYTVILGP